jgi:predicted small secreted protein
MTKTMKSAPYTAALTIAAIALALGFSGCNTVEGAGQDIKSTGKAIERTADDAKN